MTLSNLKIIILLPLIVSCSDLKVNVASKIEIHKNSPVKDYLNSTLQVYTTAKDTKLRLTKTNSQTFRKKIQPLETEVAIFINPKKTFQEYLGIGGAITDASSEVFATLNAVQQNKLLESLYGKEGIGYTIIRTSIHSSDFGF